MVAFNYMTGFLAIEELTIHSDISVFVIKDIFFTRPKCTFFSTSCDDGTLCVKSRSPEHFMFQSSSISRFMQELIHIS